jgi:hypothetical protein
MLAKKQRSCRIASFRLFHTCFALILGHIESTLELPEEQHGFASVRRLEEHFVTATQVVDKTLSTKTPIWIISLDLSKAFDGVDWKALWQELSHGISEHLGWILQTPYNFGRILPERFQLQVACDKGVYSAPDCSMLFCWWAMLDWRSENGFNLNNGFGTLFDLRFADDILFWFECRNGSAVGFTGDSFGRRWFAIEPGQNCCFDN